MNIVYISKLDGRPWGGPTYSVPKQIGAQTGYDNILWYNLVKGSACKWQDTIGGWKSRPYYRDLDDIPSGRISDLPEPFRSPDLVIMEQCYPFAKEKVIHELKKRRLRYVLIPRGELTEGAQKQKALKKFIGRILLIASFAGHAAAIQFLTDEEKNSTAKHWNGSSLVIPNGTVIPDIPEKQFPPRAIRCVSIGRVAVYHKGLDLLIGACAGIRELLISNGVTIDIYGPDREGKAESLRQQIAEAGLDAVISIHDGVYNEEKDRVLTEADVFVMTSRFEGHPTALLDALAFRLPCVITEGSNMRRAVEEYDAGWTADTTEESIAAAFVKAIAEKDRLTEKSINARRLSRNYSWESIAERSHDEYLKLINK